MNSNMNLGEPRFHMCASRTGYAPHSHDMALAFKLPRLASLQVLCQCLPVTGPTSNIIIIIIMVTFKSKLRGMVQVQVGRNLAPPI